MMRRIFMAFVAATLAFLSADACTSMIVSARASGTGRPLLWKHRDTDCLDNFVERVAATDTTPAYVALFNAGDSTLSEAWMGHNEWGFAIMNTASYNLAPDTAKYADREAEVMTDALRSCRTVDDFGRLLRERHRPMGVQANFGVIDATGAGAYFEACDTGFVRFDLADATDGVLMRTNHSLSGNDTDGMGYIRLANARELLADKIAMADVRPWDFTEMLSRWFYHSLLGCDYTTDPSVHYVVDQDFIPRRISSASVVIEGVMPGEDPDLTVMYAAVGYPPCTHVALATTYGGADECLRPLQAHGHCELADQAAERKQHAFPIKVGSGKHYVDLQYLRIIMPALIEESMQAYARAASQRQAEKERRAE